MKSSRDFLRASVSPAAIPAAAPDSQSASRTAASIASRFPARKVRARWRPCSTEATSGKVPVHRVSQGSGIMLMTDDEISEMLAIGRKAGIEVNLFIGPRATFDIGAHVYSPAGKTLG